MAKDLECDVLVAGSGASGFAAALTAAIDGLEVIMVEKAEVFGGTTCFSAGVIWIPSSRQAREAGITDDRDSVLDYLQAEVWIATRPSPSQTMLQVSWNGLRQTAICPTCSRPHGAITTPVSLARQKVGDLLGRVHLMAAPSENGSTSFVLRLRQQPSLEE